MHLPTLRLLPLLLGCALACSAAWSQTGQPKLPTVRLNAGIHNIQAELARTPDERQAGLMYRREMAANDGMLFVFEQAGVQCFWMRNTLIPLDIAFVADDGTVVNLDRMRPRTDDSHCSTAPVRYVLEMNQGWFAKRGVRPGMKLNGGPFSTARP